MKYTQGPWTYRTTGADCLYAIESNLSHRKHTAIEERVGTFETLNEENARLISAAPEMLEALELCSAALIELMDKKASLTTEAHYKALQVIKKAKGE